MKEVTEEELLRRARVLEIAGKFFEEHGKELSIKNGELLKRDRERPEWSVNVKVLTKVGLATAYYRPESNDFTVVGFALFDIFIKHAPMLSNKFITYKQFKELKELLKA